MVTTDKLILLGWFSLQPVESGGTGRDRHRHPGPPPGRV